MSESTEIEELRARVQDLEQKLNKETKSKLHLESEVKRLRNANASLQLQAEEEEEYIANKLIKRLNQLKKEKETLALQVEQEEEMLTNTLQAKLNQLQREKIELENQLEQEEEYIVNKLQKQLADVIIEKQDLERKIEADRTQILSQIAKSMESINDSITASGSAVTQEQKELTAKLYAEIEQLQTIQRQYLDESSKCRQSNAEMKSELQRLRNENFLLQQRNRRERAKNDELSHQQCAIEQGHEVWEERRFNEATKQPMDARNRSNSLPMPVVRHTPLHFSPGQRASTGFLPIHPGASPMGPLTTDHIARLSPSPLPQRKMSSGSLGSLGHGVSPYSSGSSLHARPMSPHSPRGPVGLSNLQPHAFSQGAYSPRFGSPARPTNIPFFSSPSH